MIYLNVSLSWDVGDAIPYMVGVLYKDAILNVSYVLRTLVN